MQVKLLDPLPKINKIYVKLPILQSQLTNPLDLTNDINLIGAGIGWSITVLDNSVVAVWDSSFSEPITSIDQILEFEASLALLKEIEQARASGDGTRNHFEVRVDYTSDLQQDL